MNPWVPKDFIQEKHCTSVMRQRNKGNVKFCDEDELVDGEFETMSLDSNWSVSSNDTVGRSKEKNSRNCLTVKNNGIRNSQSENSTPVGLDCEMVGVGKDKSSALARCSIVAYDGNVLFDEYVKPNKPITDYRTKWSGIRPKHMVNAITFRSARRKVKRMIKNRVLVGHALQFDLKVLKLGHCADLIRDTSKHIPLRALAGFPRNSTPSLKRLTRELLKWDIQINEHSSVEDARAAMALYRMCDKQWEKGNSGKSGQSYLEDAYWPNWTEALNNSNKK